MLKREDFLMIKALSERGVYQKDIALQLGVHPKTVSRALKRGKAPVREARGRESKLEPYKAQVDELLAEGVWNAVVILRELHAAGYEGSYTILRAYIAPKRMLRKAKQTVRFETEAGRQLQSDWGEINTEIAGQERKVYFIVNELGYSRRFHFWCSESADAEHTYEGIIRSFEYFGGVAQEVLVDNQKAAVLEHKGAQACFNARFIDLASHYDFVPRACRPYRARTKGKDERMVSYIKHHFFVRYRSFESMSHLNQMAEIWLAAEADQRVHGTVKEVVAERFAREVTTLKPLPQARYDTAYRELRQVGWDSYVDVRGNRYSVPSEFAGQRVSVHIGLDEQLHIYTAESGLPVLVAKHSLRPIHEGWVTVAAHHTQLWQETLQVERRPLQVYEEVATWS
jgi:transposase